jgi:hypothetical protein
MHARPLTQKKPSWKQIRESMKRDPKWNDILHEHPAFCTITPKSIELDEGFVEDEYYRYTRRPTDTDLID